jgi:uncharacterized protein (DUF488 family)
MMSFVYTIGYEGTDIDRFVATLKQVGIKVLADVRAVPISRKKGFSKSSLQERLHSAGIDYVHFVDLGDPKPGREAARAGKYPMFRRIYGKHLAEAPTQAALISLTEIVRKLPTALLCFERDPMVCHRSMVTDQLQLYGIESFHLFGDDPKRYARNAAKLRRRYTRQGASAA